MFLIFIALCCFSSTALSQTQANTSAITPFSSAAVSEQPQKQGREAETRIRLHTFGVGISTTDGDASTGRQSMMLSALYAYSWLPTLDIETSLQQMSMSKWYPAYSTFTVSSAFSHDIALVVRPFPFAPKFRLGIGSSARWQKSMVSSVTSIYDPVTMQYVSRQTLSGQNTFALGATLKLEYLFPLSLMFDISIRAQGHIYAPPVIGENNHVPGDSPGGAASLGLFLLIHP